METTVGVSAALIALISLARLLLSDRSLRNDMKGMQERMSRMEKDNKEQHHLKHQAVQEQVKYQMLLGTIIVLAEDCTCGALDKVQSFMDKLNPNFQSSTVTTTVQPHTHTD